MTKSIIITGATGFIGEYLVNHFSASGWKVKAFVRSVPEIKINGVEYFLYDLSQKLNENAFEDVSFLVHTAYLHYEKDNNADEVNINGTRMIVKICRKNNIQPLFLSSFSAHKAAESHYGKAKLECEKLFDLSRDIVLKPGFVIGKKGLSGRLIDTIKKASFFPLIGGGKQPIQTVCIDDLCKTIEIVLENKVSGLFHIAEPEAITMKMFYQEIALQLNKEIRFIPFSLPLLFAMSKMAEVLGLKLPVSSESILGLKHLTKFETKNDLHKIGAELKSYRESLQSILK